MKAHDLWILTEERPKIEVLKMIFQYFAKDHQCGFFGDTLRIIPVLNDRHEFTFEYEVVGFHCAKVNRVILKTVSGYSSFVDFLVFYQDTQPIDTDFNRLMRLSLLNKICEKLQEEMSPLCCIKQMGKFLFRGGYIKVEVCLMIPI